jgi:uncharacterized protein
MNTDCPAALIKGIDEFNKREFFECHETLEEYWQGYKDADREFIQGLIQVSVAYHHLLRGNPVGAIKLIRRALPRLHPYVPHHIGVDTADLIRHVNETLTKLEHGESAIECIPKIKLVLA